MITIQPPVSTPHFEDGLIIAEVVSKFNASFVNYKIAREDSASSKIIRQFRISLFPSYLFLDAQGGRMFTDVAFLSNPRMLLNIADKALEAKQEKSLVDFDAQYKSGEYNAEFLEEYITKRGKAGLNNNASLIEIYVSLLNEKDEAGYSEVLFILNAGPVVNSKAYKFAYKDKKIIDSIFKTERFEDRQVINNNIINNTMAAAISYKSETAARSAATFTLNSWTNDKYEGQKNAALKMVQYYKAIKDTANYFKHASVFYDEYYLPVSADSLRKLDAIKREKQKAIALERARLNFQGKQTVTMMVSYAPQQFSTELNNAAWSFYETGTKDPVYLSKALLWSKHSITLNPVSGFYDTYAHLLYALKQYDEAERAQKIAIETGKAEKRDTKALEEAYLKIKDRTL